MLGADPFALPTSKLYLRDQTSWLRDVEIY